MRMRCFPVVFVALGCFIPAGVAQTPQVTDTGRKLVRKIDPDYPEMARKANLTGTVKLYAMVSPDGSVKSVEPLGGSPILVQSSEKAILQWKFAPASGESKELVELHFHP